MPAYSTRIRCLHTLIAVAALFAVSLTGCRKQAPDDMLARWRGFNAELDSLSLEINDARRLGEPLGRLEQRSEELKDSLALLRASPLLSKEADVDTAEEQVPEAVPEPAAKERALNLLNWLVLGSAGIAGFLACVVFVSSLLRRRKPKAAAPPAATDEAPEEPQSAIPDTPVIHRPPQWVQSLRTRPTRTTPATAPAPTIEPDQDTPPTPAEQPQDTPPAGVAPQPTVVGRTNDQPPPPSPSPPEPVEEPQPASRPPKRKKHNRPKPRPGPASHPPRLGGTHLGHGGSPKQTVVPSPERPGQTRTGSTPPTPVEEQTDDVDEATAAGKPAGPEEGSAVEQPQQVVEAKTAAAEQGAHEAGASPGGQEPKSRARASGAAEAPAQRTSKAGKVDEAKGKPGSASSAASSRPQAQPHAVPGDGSAAKGRAGGIQRTGAGVGDVRERVAECTRDGMNAEEIARKLGLSPDHVALILRVDREQEG